MLVWAAAETGRAGRIDCAASGRALGGEREDRSPLLGTDMQTKRYNRNVRGCERTVPSRSLMGLVEDEFHGAGAMERDSCSLMHVKDRLELMIGRPGTPRTISTWQYCVASHAATLCHAAMSASHSADTRGAPVEPSSDSDEDIVRLVASF